MSKWQGKTKGGVFGYKFFIYTLKYLDLSFAYFFLIFVAFYYWIFNRKSYKVIYYFYNKRLKYSSVKSFFKVYSNYFVFGQILIDKFAILSGYQKKFTFNFDGENYLREVAENKTGALIINAHLGNFDIAGQLLERLNYKINIIMYDAERERIKKLTSSVIEQKNVNIITIKDDGSHIFEIAQAFKNNEIVAMNGDRYVDGNKTVTCNFLGEKAKFPTGPFHLAVKYGVPVFYAFAFKESKTHYHFYATKPKVYKYQGNIKKRNETIKSIIKDYIFELENKVKKYPNQWFNYYQFWEK